MWKVVLICTHWQSLYKFRDFLHICTNIFNIFSVDWLSFDNKYLLNISWEGDFLRSIINKREYSQRQVASYWSDAFQRFFIGFNLFLFDFSSLFTIIFFSPWDIDQNHWSLVLVSPMATFVKCLGFFFKLLHRLFQMSVGRSPISFWRRRKTWDSVRPPRKRVLWVSGRLRGIAPRENSCAPGLTAALIVNQKRPPSVHCRPRQWRHRQPVCNKIFASCCAKQPSFAAASPSLS